MNILVVCANGLGSSMIIELTVKKALTALGVEATVSHTNLSDASSMNADIYVCTADIAPNLNKDADKIVSIKNIANADEVAEALKPHLS